MKDDRDRKWIDRNTRTAYIAHARAHTHTYTYIHIYIHTRTRTQVKDLRDRKWIDRDTRTVYIKFALYNRQLHLFATTNLIFRYAPSGGLTLPNEATVNPKP